MAINSKGSRLPALPRKSAASLVIIPTLAFCLLVGWHCTGTAAGGAGGGMVSLTLLTVILSIFLSACSFVNDIARDAVGAPDEVGNSGDGDGDGDGDGVASYTVSLTASGVSETATISFEGTSVEITGDGSTDLSTLEDGTDFSVALVFDGDDQSCSLGNESGTVDGADVTVTMDCAVQLWSQDAFIKSSNLDNGDRFGTSIDIDGDIMVVGASGERSYATNIYNADNTAAADNSGTNYGAVYVFIKGADGNWVQDAYIKSEVSGTGDWFGDSVAVDGDTIVAGAPEEDNDVTVIYNYGDFVMDTDYATSSGSVHVFTRDGDGDWFRQAYLRPAAGYSNYDNFGRSVAISGDTILVGMPGDDSPTTGVNNTDGNNDDSSGNTDSGAVFVFTRDGSGDWKQDAFLKPAFTNSLQGFGSAVAIDGDLAVVGAPDDDNDESGVTNGSSPANNFGSTGKNSGAAYIFGRTADDWAMEAYLKAAAYKDADTFGTSVAVSGDTVVVGSPGQDGDDEGVNNTDGFAGSISGETDSGAVYVFLKETDGLWVQNAYIKSSDAYFGEGLGNSVAIDGDRIVAGSRDDTYQGTGITNNQDTKPASNSGNQIGAVFVFTRRATTGDWFQDAYFKPVQYLGGYDNYFGDSVAISGDTMVTGSPDDFRPIGSSAIINDDDTEESNFNISPYGAAWVFEDRAE